MTSFQSAILELRQGNSAAQVNDEFDSTSGKTEMESIKIDKIDADFHLASETLHSTPRSKNSGASSSEVFSSSIPKQQHGRRPQSARTQSTKLPSGKPMPPLSSIPLPVKSSGPLKIPPLLKNAKSISRTSSLSTSRTNSVANKHTLEIQFINKNKRYQQMRKDLLEKQKPVLDLYQNLSQIKKRLEELGKSVKLEEIKLVPYENFQKPLSDRDWDDLKQF